MNLNPLTLYKMDYDKILSDQLRYEELSRQRAKESETRDTGKKQNASYSRMAKRPTLSAQEEYEDREFDYITFDND